MTYMMGGLLAYISFDNGTCRRLRSLTPRTQRLEALAACSSTGVGANLLDEGYAVRARVSKLRTDYVCYDLNDGAPMFDQLIAVEDFRQRWTPARCKAHGYKDWKEALKTKWYNGSDGYEPGGPLLRQVRNDPRTHHQWLDTYLP